MYFEKLYSDIKQTLKSHKFETPFSLFVGRPVLEQKQKQRQAIEVCGCKLHIKQYINFTMIMSMGRSRISSKDWTVHVRIAIVVPLQAALLSLLLQLLLLSTRAKKACTLNMLQINTRHKTKLKQCQSSGRKTLISETWYGVYIDTKASEASHASEASETSLSRVELANRATHMLKSAKY